MDRTIGYVNELCTAFGLIIGVAAVIKIIKILMDGQAEDVPVKESLKKAKRVLGAALLCITIAGLVSVIQGYF